MTVIQPDNVNTVINDIIRPALEAAVVDGTYSLKDSNAAGRLSGLSRFILTAFSTRTTVYPQIVIEEISAPGEIMDPRDDGYLYDPAYRFLVKAKSKTDGRTIIGGIREALHRKRISISVAGLSDVKITGTSGPLMDSSGKLYLLTLSIQGKLYSKYEAP